MIFSECLRATVTIGSISAGCPNRCTGIIARVLAVMARSISSGLIE